MKQFIKKYLKIIIGIMVLLLVLFVFIQTQKTTSLETGTLKDWRSASLARRENAVKILTATDDNLNLLVACVDKMAGLPDSSDMSVRDATEFCFVGLQLKNNI
ncbi:MAG: hypothetical protein K6B71_02780 [Alphaproteobacteria bacterium]|nr:hypothetical protein [Alphaproteobacteria bacterium]